ncbi:hypothetical protein FPZ43_15745 [Mucilaginibacter pallidiroseus]|uniref:Uncharacterized protein n=1 Tax=Mucilaginibacter pallidiroseus TaxID=2599295 RepID=A0A563U319_9SPHI|nr:hypothetical protein [Mucilaginibacter pallidiroseus]TWR25738.1 hypothetical protein FPZ43_15745 [Mucilaginibacter pallidiroseus]
MIEKTLITTHGTLTISMPSRLDEITLGQMIELQETNDMSDLQAISILTGISVTDLQTVKSADDFLNLADVILSLSHQIKYLYDSDDIPKKIGLTVGKKKATLNVINNLSVEPTGAFMAARDVIAEEVARFVDIYGEEAWQDYFNPSLTACCKVLGYYFYSRATGKRYNEYEAANFAETIKQLKVTEALPIAKHFFMSYPNLYKPKLSYWQRLLQLLRKEPV